MDILSINTHKVTISPTRLGASILPGLMLTPYTMLYGRVGVDSISFSRVTQFKVTPQYGVGFQSKVSEKWSTRFEFTKTGSSGQASMGLVYSFL